jgi:hypothetical protein
MEKKYIIKDLYHDSDLEMYVADETTSREDIWHKCCEKNKKKDERFTPKVFTELKEAKLYLKEVKRRAEIDWKENGHMYRVWGKNKFCWDIYEFSEENVLS